MNPLTTSNAGGILALLLAERGTSIFLCVLFAVALIVPTLHLALPADSALHLSSYTMTLIGKYMTYALLAIAVDLVWGYCGIRPDAHRI